jgi:hypothetical protein
MIFSENRCTLFRIMRSNHTTAPPLRWASINDGAAIGEVVLRH